MILLRIWSHVLMKSLMKHFLCNAIPYEVMLSCPENVLKSVEGNKSFSEF